MDKENGMLISLNVECKKITMSFEIVEKFERKIADFFGSPFAVAFDSCTHGIEALIFNKSQKNFCS